MITEMITIPRHSSLRCLPDLTVSVRPPSHRHRHTKSRFTKYDTQRAAPLPYRYKS